MTDPDGRVLYAAPQVIKGTLMYTSEPSKDPTVTVARQKLWEFELDSLVT